MPSRSSDHGGQRVPQLRQGMAYRAPDDVYIDGEVAMRYLVAHIPDAAPWHVGVQSQELRMVCHQPGARFSQDHTKLK